MEKLKKEEIYLDLSKLSEEERKEVESILGLEIRRDKIWVILLHNGKSFDIASKEHWSLKHKKEITFSQFKELFQTSVENKEVENNGWIKIESENGLPCYEVWLGNKNDVWKGYLFINGDDYRINLIATHYQPIIKPEPPQF